MRAALTISATGTPLDGCSFRTLSRLAAETGSKGPKEYEEINGAVLGAQLTFKADCDVGRKDVDPRVL